MTSIKYPPPPRRILPALGLVISLILAFSLAACGGNSPTDPPLIETSPTGTYTPSDPVAADFTFSFMEQGFDGNAKAVTITPKSGKSTGAITVHYTQGGDPATPTAQGDYDVTFDVAAAPGYNAVTGLSAGKLSIVDPYIEMTIGNISEIKISLEGIGSSVTIDWGNGMPEAVTFYSEMTKTGLIAGKVIRIEGPGITSLRTATPNSITSLDVSKYPALGALYCSYAGITSLDVSKNTALGALDCSSTGITSLDVSKNAALVALNCSNTGIKSLDVSKNTALRSLNCESNQMNASALNALFGTLPARAAADDAEIFYSGNPGYDTCDKSIAASKYWTAL